MKNPEQSSMSRGEWIKVDLHIHTFDDPMDRLDYSARELLARAHRLGFRALAITLHNAVFENPQVFAAADRLGILLISSAEMRIEGADIILLNVTPQDVAGLRTFEDVRRLRAAKGDSLFTIAPHPFYLLGGSIGLRLLREIDCFDAIELCHFHKGWFNPNRRAVSVAQRSKKPLIATSDAHRLRAFGQHFSNIRIETELTVPAVFAALRRGDIQVTSPSATVAEILSTFYFVFLQHPLRLRKERSLAIGEENCQS